MEPWQKMSLRQRARLADKLRARSYDQKQIANVFGVKRGSVKYALRCLDNGFPQLNKTTSTYPRVRKTTCDGIDVVMNEFGYISPDRKDNEAWWAS